MNANPEAVQLFDRWGIKLANDVLRIDAREMEEELLTFGGGREIKYDRSKSDWSSECRMQTLVDARPLLNWVLVFSKTIKPAAEEFYRQIRALGPRSGMRVTEPIVVEVDDETVRSYLDGIKKAESRMKVEIQIVVAMVPNENKTRYDAIKKHCCLVSSVPSQVIKARSLEKNTLSVCSKILLQINCKLGGSLWHSYIPMKDCMIVGYDMYNDSSSCNKKVGAAVFSYNQQFSKWYSQCQFHGQQSELVKNLTDFFTNGLKKYKSVNGKLPERIILFRDGVGDGHIPVVFNDELPQITQAFCRVGGEDDKKGPRFAFVIVTKRVHTRYFKVDVKGLVNPIPGTVVDDVITRPER